jgi:hypothetical protein
VYAASCSYCYYCNLTLGDQAFFLRLFRLARKTPVMHP